MSEQKMKEHRFHERMNGWREFAINWSQINHSQFRYDRPWMHVYKPRNHFVVTLHETMKDISDRYQPGEIFIAVTVDSIFPNPVKWKD